LRPINDIWNWWVNVNLLVRQDSHDAQLLRRLLLLRVSNSTQHMLMFKRMDNGLVRRWQSLQLNAERIHQRLHAHRMHSL
jgi:hypothetical protein